MQAKPRIVQLRRSKEWILVVGSRIYPPTEVGFATQQEAQKFLEETLRKK